MNVTCIRCGSQDVSVSADKIRSSDPALSPSPHSATRQATPFAEAARGCGGSVHAEDEQELRPGLVELANSSSRCDAERCSGQWDAVGGLNQSCHAGAVARSVDGPMR